MDWSKNEYLISSDKTLLQFDRIHTFLSQEAYWCLDIPKIILERAIESSLCFGLFEKKSGVQIGFARILTDNATFAWLCDVYIEKQFRGLGLSKWLMECVMSHSDLKSLRRICLTTKDGQGLYEKFGFQVTKTPTYWMEIKDNDIYKKMKQPTGLTI